jgi:hypothetical protein
VCKPTASFFNGLYFRKMTLAAGLENGTGKYGSREMTQEAGSSPGNKDGCLNWWLQLRQDMCKCQDNSHRFLL